MYVCSHSKTAFFFQQIAEKFPNNQNESYGWYQKNHAESLAEIEEQLFLTKIRTKEDFGSWLEKTKRSLITANKK